jgi:ribosome biogenesis GTPase
MASQYSDLARLGWNEWFEAKDDCRPAETLARVVSIDRDWLLLMDQTGIFRARLAGRYLYHHRQAQELPCVGDWVGVEKTPTDDFGMIHRRLERRTALRRKSAGDAVDYQMIAANVDYVIIVQSCHYDFNIKRLERYLVMMSEGGAEPCILLTKTDLVEPAVLAAQVEEIRAAGVTAPVLTLSNVTREGIDDLKRLLLPSKTYCLVGSSGVGKSTLINQLIGQDKLQTQEISESGAGKHTTVRRELIILESGALIIDNPGMREFGVLGAEGGIIENFADLIGIAVDCRYRNCRHTGELGCAVVEAVKTGVLSQEHYDNYLKLKKETEFHQLSYGEKRKKDREFGKFIKSAKKDVDL